MAFSVPVISVTHISVLQDQAASKELMLFLPGSWAWEKRQAFQMHDVLTGETSLSTGFLIHPHPHTPTHTPPPQGPWETTL